MGSVEYWLKLFRLTPQRLAVISNTFANGAHLGFEIFVMFLGDLPVTPQPLAVIVLVEVFTEDFGHGAFRFAIVAQHLFQTVLGLGMTGAISRAGRC